MSEPVGGPEQVDAPPAGEEMAEPVDMATGEEVVDSGEEMTTPEDGAEEEMEEPMDDSMNDSGEDDSAKKDIQSKTGELSQLLNDYGQSDEELKKYVQGMIDSALENLGENEDEEVSEEEPVEDDMSEEIPEDENTGVDLPMESIRFTKAQLTKLNETILKNREREKLNKKEKRNNKKIPFNAPKFK